MRRRCHLRPHQPLLVGRLYLINRGRDGPILGLSVWCPFCKDEHSHGWGPPPFRFDEVEHRMAHCRTPAGPLWGSGYWIGLDPAAADHNRKVVADFNAALAAWEEREARRRSLPPILEPDPCVISPAT